jgi:hypothetical protein
MLRLAMHSNLRLLRLAVAAIPVVVTAVTAAAQTTLTGSIFDASGRTLPGMQLTLRHPSTGQTCSFVTTGDGWFVIPGLSAGICEPRARSGGVGAAAAGDPGEQFAVHSAGRTRGRSMAAASRRLALGRTRRLDLRLEMFDIFNRADFGNPTLIAFAGPAINEAPLATVGRIRSTVTSARQLPLGARISF